MAGDSGPLYDMIDGAGEAERPRDDASDKA